MLKIFKSSLIFSFFGFIFCFFVGYYYTGQWSGATQALLIGLILSVLEVSLSFDKSIVNALVLKEMTPIWRKRFITWGILIAVFGMRLIFPLAVVSIAAQVDPYSALKLALFEPKLYAEKMLQSHDLISAFGGSFLLMVALSFFYDENKTEHWIEMIEKRFAHWGRIEALQIFLALLTLLIFVFVLPTDRRLNFLVAGILGIIIFIAVKGVEQLLESSSQEDVHGSQQATKLARSGLGSFLYLEVLDASFSFDGVVGGFAITTNLLIIMAGLSIGAFFVRSLTIFFVENEVLENFAFLEHGAFYAIGLLAILMIADPVMHIPEWFTGLSGAVIIGISFYESIRHRKLKQAS